MFQGVITSQRLIGTLSIAEAFMVGRIYDAELGGIHRDIFIVGSHDLVHLIQTLPPCVTCYITIKPRKSDERSLA